MQVWPTLPHLAMAMRFAESFRLQDLSMMVGLEPPSSRITFERWREASFMTKRPTWQLPVKTIDENGRQFKVLVIRDMGSGIGGYFKGSFWGWILLLMGVLYDLVNKMND